MNTLEWAKSYCREKKFSVIPLNGKNPILKVWKPYQDQMASEKEIEEWFSDGKNNIGIVTGELSNLFVIDLDEGYDPEFANKLPKTVIVQTGGGGLHFLYRYPHARKIGNRAGFRPHCDVRGEGGFVVAPPSVHKSGKEYRFAVDHPSWNGGIAEAPDWLLDEICSSNAQGVNKKKDLQSVLGGVAEGQRNESAAQVAGRILGRLEQKVWESIGWDELRAWNLKNIPPLPENELKGVFESIMGKELAKVSETAEAPKLEIIRGEELFSMDIPEPEFLVENLVPKNGITMIVGEPNSHKSWIMIEIAQMVIRNQLVFGKFTTTKAKALYIDLDSSISEMRRRVGKTKGEEPNGIDFMRWSGFRIDSKENLRELLRVVKENDYSLVIFDSFRDVWDGNENDSQQAQAVMGAFAELLQLGCTVILSHHGPRQIMGTFHAVRGSTVFEAKCDSVLVVRKGKETGEMQEISIEQIKLRQGMKIPKFNIEMIEKDNHIRFEFIGKAVIDKTKINEAIDAIKRLLTENGKMCEAEILESLGRQHALATLRRAFKAMKKEKMVIWDHAGGRKKYFHLVELAEVSVQPVRSLSGSQSQ